MPEPGPLVHGQEGDIDGVEGDGPAVRLDHAQDHAESGGFSGPVSTQQADDFALAEEKADIIDDNAAVVGFDKLGDFEKVHYYRWPRGG